MRVGFFQFQPDFGQVGRNLDRIETALAGCRADLVVLPELATTGYNFTSRAEALSLAEPVPDGPSILRLQALSRQENVSLVVGLAELGDAVPGDAAPGGTAEPVNDEPLLYNSAVLVTPDGFIGLYRKVHLFDGEKNIFEAGDLGFPVFDLRGAGPRSAETLRIGIMICFDWRFPEAARGLALQGADLLAHPSNLLKPWCQQAMVTRSLENLVYSITANRTGTEDRGGTSITFTGRSQVLDPTGRPLAVADESSTALEIVTIDPAAARNKRVNERNDLFADRRPEQYRLP